MKKPRAKPNQHTPENKARLDAALRRYRSQTNAADKRCESLLKREEERSKARRRAINKERVERVGRAEAEFRAVQDDVFAQKKP